MRPIEDKIAEVFSTEEIILIFKRYVCGSYQALFMPAPIYLYDFFGKAFGRNTQKNEFVRLGCFWAN